MGNRFEDLKNALMRMEVEPSKLAKNPLAYNRLVSPAVQFNKDGDKYPGIKVTEERAREWIVSRGLV